MNLNHTTFFLASALSLYPCNAALVAYDGFGGGPRTDLHGSASGTGWTGPWSEVGGGIFLFSVVPDGLTYPGLATTNGAVRAPSNPASDYGMYQRAFQAQNPANNTMYVSFLYRPEVGQGTLGGLQFAQLPRAVFAGTPGGMYTYGFGYADGLFNVSNWPTQVGQTVLLVIEIERVPLTASVSYRMFVNPMIGQPKLPFPLAQCSLGGVLPSSMMLITDGAATINEIRVGQTWADVLPAQATGPSCDSIDFNDDTSLFDPQDIEAFLSVYSEGPCVPASATCGDIDFNNDASVFDPCDISSFLVAFSEGPCSLCGE